MSPTPLLHVSTTFLKAGYHTYTNWKVSMWQGTLLAHSCHGSNPHFSDTDPSSLLFRPASHAGSKLSGQLPQNAPQGTGHANCGGQQLVCCPRRTKLSCGGGKERAYLVGQVYWMDVVVFGSAGRIELVGVGFLPHPHWQALQEWGGERGAVQGVKSPRAVRVQLAGFPQGLASPTHSCLHIRFLCAPLLLVRCRVC